MNIDGLTTVQGEHDDITQATYTPVIDTGRGSLLHWLFRIRFQEHSNMVAPCVRAYVLLVLFHFGLPTIIAFITMDDSMLFKRANAEGSVQTVRVFYFSDYNVLFASLVTVPFLVIRLLTERPFIHKSVKGLRDSGVIRFGTPEKEQSFHERCSDIYRYIKSLSQ